MNPWTNKRSAPVMGVVGIVLVAVLWFWFSVDRLKKEVEAGLAYDTDIVAAIVAPHALSGLSFTEDDAATPAYVGMRDQFVRLGKVLRTRDVKGIYAMKLTEDDKVRFIVDDAPSDDPWHSEPGVIYEEPPSAVREVLGDGRARFVGPYTDEYGSFYSVFSAIRGDDGAVVAVAGADVETATFDRLLYDRMRLPATGFLTILALYLAAYLLFARQRLAAESIRQQEQAALRNAREREAFLMNIGEGVIACDASGKVIYANRFAREKVCGNEGECIGQEYAVRWAMLDERGNVLPDAEQPLAILLRGGTMPPSSGKPYYLRTAQGGRIPVAVSIAVVDGDHANKVIVLSFRDMTKEAEIDQMKSDFISVAVHQLKTPLTALKWAVDMLPAPKDARSQEERFTIDTVSEVTAHLNELVNSLLNITRIESGRLSVEPKPTDLAVLVEESIHEIAVSAKNKKQSLNFRKDPSVPILNVDGHLVQEVFKNFLTNAVKYTPEGGHIEVAIEVKDDNVVYSVKDDGLGIPAEEQKRIFEKFFRAGNVVSLSEDGTGLGLYFARQIAELSGGRMWFESAVGKGSKFFFSLPVGGSKERKGEMHLG